MQDLLAASMDSPDVTPASADADAGDVRLAQRGDGEALARLIRRHQVAVARQMWRFTRDPRRHAELVQDVFVNAWRSLDGYRGRGPFLHWLRKLAVRTGYAFWRERDRLRPETPWDETLAETVAAGPAEGDAAARAGDVVHALLDRLPARDRVVLVLLHLDGCSVAEAAERLGWSRVMVKVQAWRARRKLETILRTEE